MDTGRGAKLSMMVEARFGVRMSLEEWAELPEDTPGELVDGVLVEEEVPTLLHETVIVWLTRKLGAWAEPRGGFVFGSGGKYKVSPRRGRMPDMTVYLRRRPQARGLVDVPPDIAIEVVSERPSDRRRVRVEKVEDYASFGVPQYWLVDPEGRTLQIMTLTDSGLYAQARGAAEGVLDDIPGCEGLALDLDDLWSELDRLIG